MNIASRPLTWLSPASGQTYVSLCSRDSADIAIPDRPATMPSTARFNPATQAWEQAYEVANPDTEVTIGEAEALWAEKQKGNVLASVLLKTLEL